MAAYVSHSPRVRVLDPVTPIHSPHHSVHSSTSSRTPLHTLTLHEYRKQQNSPASQSSTPSGKTLRRKAAASGLNEVERIPSRPLHFSQSTHQLSSYQSLPPSPPHFRQLPELSDQPFRSQSTEPHAESRATFKEFASSPAGKVRKFKPIKRLPKPLAVGGYGLPPPHPLASVTSTHPHVSPLQTASFPSAENSDPSDSQTTPSTFSLSRFPQPPHVANLSVSQLNDENEPPRLNAASFAATAPATPPATPAVIHYRGASFDLVNPRDSLLYHDIVTPSRELDSTEYLPLRSSEDPLLCAEMAPKRALYGDLSSAYASIITRHNDSQPGTPNADLPLPPTPTYRSPGSSDYTSAVQSPDSTWAISPRTVNRPDQESRFSLKHLTRTLTKKLGKGSEKNEDEELQDLTASRISLASASFEGEFPRPLNQSYHAATPRSPGLLADPVTPVAPLDQVVHPRDAETLLEQPIFHPRRYSSAPLASMVPDDPSTPLGRGLVVQPSISEGDIFSKPYYDDLDSIYPSSSIYTGDEQGRSIYAPSQASVRNSNAFSRFSGGTDPLADEYKSEALFEYMSSGRISRRTSKPLAQEIFHRSLQQGNNKTDTISGFIDQYKRGDSSHTSQPTTEEGSNGGAGLVTSSSSSVGDQAQDKRAISGFSQFAFDIQENSTPTGKNLVAHDPDNAGRLPRLPIAHDIGPPPPILAPLAPAFEYDEDYQLLRQPSQSEVLSGTSSYEDTRQLLQLSQLEPAGVASPHLEPSSSYSQTEESGAKHLEPSSPYSQPETPTAAPLRDEFYEDVERVEDIEADRRDESIPAIWAHRNSGDRLRSKNRVSDASTVYGGYKPDDAGDEGEEDNREDWETVGNDTRGGRLTPGESLADYSSSEGSRGSRDSMGFSSSLPVWTNPQREPGSFHYNSAGHLGSHQNPFTSSPPSLAPYIDTRSASDNGSLGAPVSKKPVSPTAPAFYENHDHANLHGTSSQPQALAPWVNPYALSDKETQELLASGPNEDILYNKDPEQTGEHQTGPPPRGDLGPVDTGHKSERVERESTFEKLTLLGPKGNLTGTPLGTGMHEVGSSEADNSSPGIEFPSSPYDRAQRMGSLAVYQVPSRVPIVRRSFVSSSTRESTASSPGFYVSPGRTASVHRAIQQPCNPDPYAEEQERPPSQVTLFPRPVPESLFSGRQPRRSLRSSSFLSRSHRHSRAAVPGQTKLRQMVLAPDAQTLSSNHSTRMSRFLSTAGSERPSTANTNTPLRANFSNTSLRLAIANEHSPHLLCPERVMSNEEEEEQRKLSWAIFAVFCILPPMLLLYRSMADFIIVNVTKGRIFHAHPKPKRIALGAGIAINLGISSAILIPILIAHATGAL